MDGCDRLSKALEEVRKEQRQERSAIQAVQMSKCPLWLEWNENGNQYRKSAKSRNWEIANKAARKLEEELDLKVLGVEPPKKADHISIQSAVDLYLKDMAEPERCIIIERVKAGMRRARLEGRQIGRSRLDVNRQQVVQDRRSGMSLTQVAKKHGISRASVCRLMKEANESVLPVLAAGDGQQASAAGVP
jgi:DNA-directed RNA polymerase specialized sigma subunit